MGVGWGYGVRTDAGKGMQPHSQRAINLWKKGKNRGKKGEKGRGAMRKKVTFGGDRARKSGGITPTISTSNVPLYPSRTLLIFAQS